MLSVNCKDIPLNVEENRCMLSAAFALVGDSSMTPVMCGFYLQAISLDTSTDAFLQARTVANRIHATYMEDGMELHFAMAATMRIKVMDPKLFNVLCTADQPALG